MPLIQREVQPIFLCHGLDTIPDSIADELQYVTNFTLTSIIRQLSDIARLAEDVFVELLSETNLVCQKSNALQDRIDKISVMVTGLDPVYDQDTLEDFLSKTRYQSELYDDQTILDSKTQPLALQQTRSMCDPVPPLNRLDPYRVDGKEALKTYTNPKYFFELWCQEMGHDIKREEEEKAERRRKEKEEKRRQKHENKSMSKKMPAPLEQAQARKLKNARMAKGPEFMDEPTENSNNPSSSEELHEGNPLKSQDEGQNPEMNIHLSQNPSKNGPPKSTATSLQPSSTSQKASHGSSQPSPHQLDLAPPEVPIGSLQPSIASTGPTTSPDSSSASLTTSVGSAHPTNGLISIQEPDVVSPQHLDTSSQPDATIAQFSLATTPEFNSTISQADLAMDHIPPVAPQPPHPPPGLQSVNVQLVVRRESRSNLLDAIRQGIPLKPVPRAASLQNEECDIVKALLDRRQVLAPDYDTDSDTSSYFSTEEEDEVDNDQS